MALYNDQDGKRAAGRCMSSRWTGIVWALTGIAAAAPFLGTYKQARPEAALTLEVGRNEALALARDFVRERGVDLTEYREAITFLTDGQTKSYLEKELSASEANRLMASEVVPWYWYVRFFVPQQEVEYTLAIAPDGRLVLRHATLESVAEMLRKELGR